MTKKHVYTVGERVGSFYDENEDIFGIEHKNIASECVCDMFGTVQSIIPSNNFLDIKWDEDYMNSPPNKPLDPRLVLPEKELREISTRLEKEFEDFSKQVKERIKVVAKELQAINKDCKKQGYQLSEMYDAVQPLRNRKRNCIRNRSGY